MLKMYQELVERVPDTSTYSLDGKDTLNIRGLLGQDISKQFWTLRRIRKEKLNKKGLHEGIGERSLNQSLGPLILFFFL